MLEQQTSSYVIYLRFRSLSSEVYGEHCLRTQHSRDSSCTQEDFLRYTDLVSSQLHVRCAKVVCLGSVRVPIPEKFAMSFWVVGRQTELLVNGTDDSAEGRSYP